ncbi:MAG TPA: hypothetical protein VN181_02365 [Thermoanaerobaculia bacterium]|nr:hypothetical protein [Thermoanaerobaculia bacterium]
MTITIKNLCNVAWTRFDYELHHGKWSDDHVPTFQIVADPGNDPKTPGIGTIASQKRTGAGYGTQGSCAYAANDQQLIDHPTAPKLLSIQWSDSYASSPPWVKAYAPPPYLASVHEETTSQDYYRVTVTLSPAPAQST